MYNFYVLVNDAFLKTINKKSQKKLKKHIDEYGKEQRIAKDKYRCYVRMCPYCNHISILTCGIHKDENEEMEPINCAICGESSPYQKITYSIKKAQNLYGLSVFCASGDNDDQQDIENERTLLEQCVVVLATGIELFFKEIYILSMDLKYVKPEYTLHSKFNQDVKNDFLNVGKTIKKFKTEFKIELREILGQEKIDKLTLLMLMRNAIVHNNGYVDSIFINNISKSQKEKYTMGSPIPITNDDIAEFIATVKIVLERGETEFDKLIVPELQFRMKSMVESFES